MVLTWASYAIDGPSSLYWVNKPVNNVDIRDPFYMIRVPLQNHPMCKAGMSIGLLPLRIDIVAIYPAATAMRASIGVAP